MSKLGRNDSCHCGSGKKYKKCCLARDQAAARPRIAATEGEEDFIAELRPDLDEEVDGLLRRLEEGEGRGVESDITELWEENPNYHLTNYAMGVYKAQVAKDPAGAIPFFEKAVKIFPPLPEAHFNLGMAARQVADVAKAVAAFRAARRYSADSDIADLARKELEFLETVLRRTTPFRSLDAYVANAQLFEEAFQRLASGHYGQAVELFKGVLAGNPKHVQSYGNMGLAYAGLGQKSLAMACFERALELDAQYEPAILNRRSVAGMREGEPFVPSVFLETEFYLDKLRGEPKRNLWA